MESKEATILVVEDDRNSAMLLVDLLTAHGYHVVTEESGIAATNRLKEQANGEAVALVLLDLRLPEQTGFRVAECIRSNPATAHIPIIAVSAYNDRQNRLRAYQAGVNVVLSKPVDTAELSLVVRNHLTMQGS